MSSDYLSSPNQPSQGIDVGGFGNGLEVEAISTSVGSCPAVVAGQTDYRCSLGYFPGGTATLSLTVSAITPGTYQLYANPTLNSHGPATITITVDPATADLWLRASSQPLSLPLGRSERLGIVVGNTGYLPSNASLVITPPAEVEVVAVHARDGTCGGKPVVCNLGAIAPQGSDLVIASLRGVKAGRGKVVLIISGDAAESDLSNNTATLDVSVTRPRAAPAPTP